jgi:hypothetical protein
MSMSGRQLTAAAAFVLAAFVAVEAGAATQMYKCVAGGRTVYQQQACAVSEAPEPAASAASGAAKASAPADPGSAAARKLRRPSPPVSSAPATLR